MERPPDAHQGSPPRSLNLPYSPDGEQRRRPLSAGPGRRRRRRDWLLQHQPGLSAGARPGDHRPDRRTGRRLLNSAERRYSARRCWVGLLAAHGHHRSSISPAATSSPRTAGRRSGGRSGGFNVFMKDDQSNRQRGRRSGERADDRAAPAAFTISLFQPTGRLVELRQRSETTRGGASINVARPPGGHPRGVEGSIILRGAGAGSNAACHAFSSIQVAQHCVQQVPAEC